MRRVSSESVLKNKKMITAIKQTMPAITPAIFRKGKVAATFFIAIFCGLFLLQNETGDLPSYSEDAKKFT